MSSQDPSHNDNSTTGNHGSETASAPHRPGLRIGSLTQTVIKGASGAGGAFALGSAFALLAQLVLARTLGVTHYGYYAYAFAWVMILAEVCRLGFQTSLVRFVAAYRTEQAWSRLKGMAIRSPQFVLLASVAAALAVVGGAFALADAMPTEQRNTFLVAALLVPPMALLGVAYGILQGYRRTAKALLPFRTFTHGGTLFLVLLAAATVGLAGATHAMALTLTSALVALAIAFHWIRQAVAPDTRGVQAEYHSAYWLRISLPLLFMSGMNIIMKHTDTVMLGILIDTTAAGIYYPVARMAELAAFGMISVNAIAAPLIAEMHTRGARAELQRLVTLAALFTTAITVSVLIGFWLLAEPILALFGAEFTAAVPALFILLGGQLVQASCGAVIVVMTMTGDQDRAAMVFAAGATLNIALNLLLIPAYGINGAAAATAITMAFWTLTMTALVLHRHGLNTSVLATISGLRRT